ncbi:hypothetical protein K1T71_014191 [Dendrolimus kikuchii]|uniref:Uncharacterized protein n=1 Tax=Dendrolimus kikuchii TaxID=765133 RepID=A0ACC1CFG4_9NEOP|nr:hypothetical protein K1T71_014191 [Dendrolimus kikuchii]
MLRTILTCFAIQAVIIKSTHSQCIGRNPYDIDYIGPYSPCTYDGYRDTPFPFGLSSFGLSSAFSSPYGPMSLFGNFPFSKITTTGNARMSVLSDNIVEGLVSVAGRLPFMATIGVEGTFPTFGTGVVNYNCGNLVGIYNEFPGAVLENYPIVTPTFAPAVAPVLPSAAFGYPPFAGYDYAPLGYSPVGYDAYVGDLAYAPYGFGGINCGAPIAPIVNYDTTIDGYCGNSFNGYGYTAVY